MNTDKIIKTAELLKEARGRLARAKDALAHIQSNDHTDVLRISIGQTTFNVTEITPDRYHVKTRRGFDMIRLGAIKCADAAVDQHAAIVSDLEKELAALVEGSVCN